ncbi:hypothetical protein BJY52DRAFT_1419379 [Lactarius psammicola]|nr:hypothetical protein BJY52DRAFT_1419379 [Lactarius psammicola]
MGGARQAQRPSSFHHMHTTRWNDSRWTSASASATTMTALAKCVSLLTVIHSYNWFFRRSSALESNDALEGSIALIPDTYQVQTQSLQMRWPGQFLLARTAQPRGRILGALRTMLPPLHNALAATALARPRNCGHHSQDYVLELPLLAQFKDAVVQAATERFWGPGTPRTGWAMVIPYSQNGTNALAGALAAVVNAIRPPALSATTPITDPHSAAMVIVEREEGFSDEDFACAARCIVASAELVTTYVVLKSQGTHTALIRGTMEMYQSSK